MNYVQVESKRLCQLLDMEQELKSLKAELEAARARWHESTQGEKSSVIFEMSDGLTCFKSMPMPEGGWPHVLYLPLINKVTPDLGTAKSSSGGREYHFMGIRTFGNWHGFFCHPVYREMPPNLRDMADDAINSFRVQGKCIPPEVKTLLTALSSNPV